MIWNMDDMYIIHMDDMEVLLRRLEVSYGLGGAVLSWFQSYLDGRTQCVRCGSSQSDPTPVLFAGVGPRTDSIFTAPCYSNGAVMGSYDVRLSVRP